jgi:membrane fusion protein (multidrug efflux system)
MAKMAGARFLRISIILVLLVVGATAGGLYFYYAASEGTEASQAQDATDPAEQTDGETRAEAEVSDEDDEDAETPIPVNVAEVGVGNISTYITATANLVPEDEVTVLAEAEGRVTRLLVEEGDRVEAGQLLATLLRDEMEILVHKARLAADNARLAYERASRMSADNLVSQEDFDKNTMDHRIAEQELAEAQWRLEKTEIRAPFDGRVTLRTCTLGQNVRSGDELFVVTDFDPLIARIYLPEKEVLALDEGRAVRITLKADDGVRFAGRIRQISPVVDTATGTVKVTVTAIEPPAVVRPGGFVAVDITRETHEDALVLPKQAVLRELKMAHVFIARDGVAEKRVVTLGLEEDDRVEVLTGLDPGERIVIAGQGGLEDGSSIKILPEDTEAQASNVDDETDLPTQG